MSDHSIDTRNSNNKQVDASNLSSMEEDQISTNNTSLRGKKVELIEGGGRVIV